MRFRLPCLPFRELIVACLGIALAAALATPALARDPSSRRNRHVILVSTDGLRSEEVFSGADEIGRAHV